MGTYFQPNSYTQMHAECEKPQYVNDMLDITTEQREKNTGKIGETQVGNTLDIVPRCGCHRLKGHYYENMPDLTCDNCGEPVVEVFRDNVTTTLWLRQPRGVAPLIKLNVFEMMHSLLMATTRNKFDILAYIVDPYYKVANLPKTVLYDLEVVIQIIAENGGKRGYSQFINNFDNYLRLFREKILVSGDAYQVKCFYELIDKLKAEDKLFSEYLPLPNRTLLIQERSDSTADMARIYMDDTMAAIFDAINGMRGIDHPVVARPLRARDVATAKFYLNITTAIVDYFDKILGSKPGKIRRSQCGSRGYATGRTVMAARTMPHKYDEIIPPWVEGITVYQPQITNKLLKMEYTVGEMNMMFQAMASPVMSNAQHVEWYNLFNKILDELIAESPEKRLPWWANRNPTMLRGSTQLMWAPDINRDPRCKATGHPILNCNVFNLDFDGDEMNFFAFYDMWLVYLARGLGLDSSYLSNNRPFAVSDAAKLPAPVSLTAAMWLNWVQNNAVELTFGISSELDELLAEIKAD